MFVGSKDQNVAPEAVVRAKATIWSEGHKKTYFAQDSISQCVLLFLG